MGIFVYLQVLSLRSCLQPKLPEIGVNMMKNAS